MNNMRLAAYSFLLALCAAIFIALAQSNISLISGDVTAIKGAVNVTFPVYLENNESVAGFQVIINYTTPCLTFRELRTTPRTQNATLLFNNIPPVLKIALLVNNASDEISSGSGPVLYIIFDVNETAVTDTYPVNLSDIVITNISALSMPFGANNGIFEIVNPYNFTFLPPISTKENFTLQDGSTLPLKFNVTDGTEFVHDDSVRVAVLNTTTGFYKEYNASGTGDDFIRINDGEFYIVNIHTDQLNMSLGLHDIIVNFSNYQKEEIVFELVEKSVGRGRDKD